MRPPISSPLPASVPSFSHSRHRMDPKTYRARREEGLPVSAVTCGRTTEEAVHRRVPLAAGSALRGSLEGMISQASHRINPCPLCRPAPAGSRGGGGNGPVAGRLADAERAFDLLSHVWASSHFQRKVRHVPDEAGCRFEPLVSGWRLSGTRPPVGCGHHPAAIGPARKLRHPACLVSDGTCTPTKFPNGTACARPSGPSPASNPPAVCAEGGSGVRGDARCLRRRIVLHDTGSEVMLPSCLIVVACGTSAETAIPFRRPP